MYIYKISIYELYNNDLSCTCKSILKPINTCWPYISKYKTDMHLKPLLQKHKHPDLYIYVVLIKLLL